MAVVEALQDEGVRGFLFRVLLVCVWGGLALIPAKIAGRKFRNSIVWWLLGVVSLVLPALVAALLVSDRSGRPEAVAHKWLRLVRGGDLRGAWFTTGYELRLDLARTWLGDDPIPPDAVEALAGGAVDHPLWPAFEEDLLRWFAENVPPYSGSDWMQVNEWTRRIGPGRTEVTLVYLGPLALRVQGHIEEFPAPEKCLSVRLELRYAAREWLVVGGYVRPPGSSEFALGADPTRRSSLPVA